MGRVLGHLLLLESVVVHLPQELKHFRLRVRTGNRGFFERGDEGLLLLFGPGSGLAVLFELPDALLPPLAREAGYRDQASLYVIGGDFAYHLVADGRVDVAKVVELVLDGFRRHRTMAPHLDIALCVLRKR